MHICIGKTGSFHHTHYYFVEKSTVFTENNKLFCYTFKRNVLIVLKCQSWFS